MCRTGTSPEEGLWQPRHCRMMGEDIRRSGEWVSDASAVQVDSGSLGPSQVYSSTTPAASSNGVISSKLPSLRVFSELYSEPNA